MLQDAGYLGLSSKSDEAGFQFFLFYDKIKLRVKMEMSNSCKNWLYREVPCQETSNDLKAVSER